MPLLVFNPGSPDSWEIQLQPGVNSIGRGFGNDFKISDASVSTNHCQIIVGPEGVRVKDLDSTNGTFVDGGRVSEAQIAAGQTLRLGNVELAFVQNAGEPARTAQKPATLALASASRIAVAVPRLQTSPGPVSARPVLAGLAPAGPVLAGPVLAGLGTAAVPDETTGDEPRFCRFHPKTQARFLCEACAQTYCELCVASRQVGGVPRKFCRQCGAELAGVAFRLRPPVERGFFERLPGAFAYPVRGIGLIIVFVGIVLVALLRWGVACLEFRTARMMVFGVIIEIFAGGYLFAYLQGILHSTSAEDRELPDLPGLGNFFEDVILPFLRLLSLILLCFGPALGLGIAWAYNPEPPFAIAFFAALGFGSLYFPMAFLAVAILDSLPAASPLLVVPSILRVPGQYATALCLFALAAGAQILGSWLIHRAFPDAMVTHAMSELFGWVASVAFLSFLVLYLAIVALHALGLIFVAGKEDLGWMRK